MAFGPIVGIIALSLIKLWIDFSIATTKASSLIDEGEKFLRWLNEQIDSLIFIGGSF